MVHCILFYLLHITHDNYTKTLYRYEWKKNGIILNQNLHNIQKGADGTITIQPATSADEGYYQCFAGNQYGTALSNTTHLERAYFGSAPETPVVHNLTFREGQHHFMKCDPRRSFPKETYIWEIFNSTNDRHPMTLRLTERLQVAENGRTDLFVILFNYNCTK